MPRVLFSPIAILITCNICIFFPPVKCNEWSESKVDEHFENFTSITASTTSLALNESEVIFSAAISMANNNTGDSVNSSTDGHFGELTASMRANWMAKLPEKAKNISIFSLAIPGSHDSGAYDLRTELGLAPDHPDIENKWWYRMFPEQALKITRNWSKTQEVDITTQLKNGVRYLDIRTAPMKDDKLSTVGNESLVDNLYFVHALYGPKIVDILAQVKSFIDKHPQELIILHFQHFIETPHESQVELAKYMDKLFASKLVPASYQNEDDLSLNFLSSKGYQVIIFYPVTNNVIHKIVWPGSKIPNPWANTTRINFLLHFLKTYLEQKNATQLYVTQGVLTPDDRYVSKHLFSSLKKSLVTKVNPVLSNWVNAVKSLGPNIVMTDFVELNGYQVVDKVIAMNME